MKAHSHPVSLGVIKVMLAAVFLIIVALNILPSASAIVESFGTFKQYEPANLIQTYNSSACNISAIVSPSSVIYPGGSMTKNGLRFNYTFTSTNETGKYNVCGDCNTVPWCANFVITSSGSSDSLTLLLILFLGGFILLVIAASFKNEYFSFFSGCAFIIGGVYMMIYGLGSLSDTYTRMASLLSIGIGLVLCVAAVWDLTWGEDNEDSGGSVETED